MRARYSQINQPLNMFQMPNIIKNIMEFRILVQGNCDIKLRLLNIK